MILQALCKLLHACRVKADGLTRRLRTGYYRRLLGAMGPGGAICSNVRIADPANVYLAGGVLLNPGVVLQAYGDARIDLGRGVHVSFGVHILTAGLSTAEGLDTSRHVAGDVRVGDGAWIGAQAVILPGVTVGAGAVIAAGAVVTRDVPAHTVAAGVPARVVRHLPTGTANDQPERMSA